MTRTDLELFLPTAGWLKDTYDHFKKTVETTKGTRHYRIKMQANSCRIEVQCHHEATEYSPASNSYVRVGGDYYKNIRLVEDGKKVVIGGTILKSSV